MSEEQIRRYRFGPLERRGLIGSLRATQVIPMALSLAAAVVLMRTLPAGAGVFVALGLVLVAAPFRGETVGVVKDVHARTYTAILAVRVTSFGLLDRSEQETRQAG